MKTYQKTDESAEQVRQFIDPTIATAQHKSAAPIQPSVPNEQAATTVLSMETQQGSTSVQREQDSLPILPVQPDQPKRTSTKQRKVSLDEYRATFLRVPKITDRKPLFLSAVTRDRLDEIVRKLGSRGMSVSGLLENLAMHHLEIYEEDFEQWKRL